MPIRITGMNSGLDTESIITELVKAQKVKSENIKKKQTTLQWKQDAWKELNSKIYKLFNSTLNNMRLATDYSKKTSDVSNSSIAKVITSDSAMNATQKLKVENLATTGYMTGKEVKEDINKNEVTKSTKLTDMGISADSTVTVMTGGKATDIKITSNTTVGSFVAELQAAGVEASFDEKNHRFHIAAKKSGKDNDFSLIAANSDGTVALDKLGILEYGAGTIDAYDKVANMTAAEKESSINADVAKRLQTYKEQRENLLKQQTELQTKTDDVKKILQSEFKVDIEAKLQEDPDYKKTLQEEIDKATGDDKTKLESQLELVKTYEENTKVLGEIKQSIDDTEFYLDVTDENNIKAGSELTKEVTAAWDAKITEAKNIVANQGSLAGKGVEKSAGEDAKIVLNGVIYEGGSNTFEINGLTITALQKSDEEVTVTTRQDTDGIYDMIKNFIKEYSSLINEMDKLYNAESTKGYDPLTDDEKSEMSDSDVEKWEKKIKDSILRRDSTLSTVSSAMKNMMQQGITVNGKTMYLANFGIETLGYFSAAENEKNAYHINGDADDSTVSSKENTLKAAIAADPDTVISFFSQLSQNMYSQLNSLSSSIEGVRSFGSFYDDKRMKDEYDSYTTKIKKEEERLTAMEEKWYNKFSAMETALAKMQSNQSAVSALLGG